MAPNKSSLPEKYRGEEDNFEEETNSMTEQKSVPQTAALPETETLWYMSNSKEHRYLSIYQSINLSIYQKVDVDGSGVVEFSEFVRSLVNK